ncbi:MAG TPA: Asp-tRNA(Asn)/Glu-tRNA(Gln) amidotransferase subunit GatB [Casimicrobiaceae bacterium]|nr:Asp-tRNA(Asn)/Glu-tRNA(Gln) amidotransferase subunit GatB [Casimicrobiaceae bacterium]
MTFEVVIGIETHVQLSTASKIFSGASTAFGAPPNTQASAVDIALPGVLPVLNRGAVERGMRFALAVGGAIHRRSVFARKNYFYPDLPKGYQISQYEIPLVKGGAVTIEADGRQKVVRLTRAHLEEDAGKSLHEGLPDTVGDVTGIDLNRAGTPLLEIVSEPDLRSSAEAVAYAKKLHSLVVWIGICDGNMQEGSFRCDANVSVRRTGEKLGTRCEIKNLNSFRFLQQAIDFEVRRQVELIEDGGSVVQETRLYDPDRDETRPMRSKEDAQDYRYFPDPDLPPLAIDDAWVQRVLDEMPELPEPLRDRLVREHGLSEYDAAQLTTSRALVDYYAATVDAMTPAEPNPALRKLVANWVLGEVSAALNRSDTSLAEAPVSPSQLAGLLRRVEDQTLSGKMAKDVFDAMWGGEATGDDAADLLIERRGLRMISDAATIDRLVLEVLAANAAIVAEFRAGKQKAFNSLVGQVMKASKGKANPAEVNAALLRKLGS